MRLRLRVGLTVIQPARMQNQNCTTETKMLRPHIVQLFFLDTQVVIHGNSNVLLRTKISLRGLNRAMPK